MTDTHSAAAGHARNGDEAPAGPASTDDDVTLAGGNPVPRTEVIGVHLGDSTRGAAEVRAFLGRFGYLAAVGDDPRATGFFDDDAQSALRNYQRFMGLPETGTVDDATAVAMATPRCGEPDLDDPARPRARVPGEASFSLNNGYPGWDDLDLTWRLSNQPTEWGAPNENVHNAVRLAFDMWRERFPDVRFTKVGTGQPRDIDVSFRFREHCSAPAFTDSNPLAHAPNQHRGQVHMNDAFTWRANWQSASSSNEYFMHTVTAHELGHVLGLGHSTNPDALMWPSLDQSQKPLHADDIAGVRAKYPLAGRDPSLLFYDGATGTFAVGKPAPHGRTWITQFVSESGAFAPWTHIAGCGDASMLFYNRGNGQYSTGFPTDDGFVTQFVSEPGAFADWSHIAGAGNGRLLFYNDLNGQWSTATLDVNGNFHTVSVSQPGSFSHWTDMVGTGTGAMLFYDRPTGRWSTGVLDPGAGFSTVFVSDPGSFAPWTHVVSAGNGAILTYNRPTGQWSTGLLTADGDFSTTFVSDPGSMSTEWTHITGSGYDYLLFYSSVTRRWSTGLLQKDGSFQTLRVSSGGEFGPWTHIAPARGW